MTDKELEESILDIINRHQGASPLYITESIAGSVDRELERNCISAINKMLSDGKLILTWDGKLKISNEFYKDR